MILSYVMHRQNSALKFTERRLVEQRREETEKAVAPLDTALRSPFFR